MSNPWAPSGQSSLEKIGQINLKQLPKGAIGAALVVILALFVLFATYFTIDQGERGVILHLGKVVGEAEPGLHFKLPVLTRIQKISVQIQKEAFEKTAQIDTRLQA